MSLCRVCPRPVLVLALWAALAPGSILAQAPTDTPPPSSEPLVAEEAPEEDEPEAKSEAPEPAPQPSPVVAAGWCVVRSSGPAPPEPEPLATDEEATEPETIEPEPLGCDVGVGAALYRFRRAALVGVIGSKSLGFGLAWIIGRPAGRTLAIAAGYVCPYGSDGIRTDNCNLALGATISFLRAGTGQ